MAVGPKTVVIAQARMGSTRLPGKVLAEVAGKTIVERVLERAKRSALVDEVAAAIPDLPDDDQLERHITRLGVAVVRGSSDDVLSRYCDAIRATGAEVVVRVTCDCPLIDPDVIDRVISAFREDSAAQFCSNTLRRTYPLGLDTEVVSAEALLAAERDARESSDREHVTSFVYHHPKRFGLRNVEAPEWARRPEYRLTVDETADLDLIRAVYARLGEEPTLRAVIALLDSDAELALSNRHVSHRHTQKPSTW